MTALHVLTAEPLGEGVITLLENLLAMAREDGLSSLAVAGVNRDGTTLAEWSAAPSLPLLIGATARLQHRLNLEADA